MYAATQSPAAGPGLKAAVGIGIALWFALAAGAVLAGLVAAPPGEPPLPVLVAVAAPLAVAFWLYRASAAFRGFVLGLDARLLAALQGWRVAGAMFLALYAFGVLPGIFAFPAGLGDMAVGVTAPLVVMALINQPGFAASRGYVIWNLLGIFDFVVAVGTGTLASGAIPGFAFAPTTAALTAWPVALVPAFLVPLFAMLHLAALAQARAARRSSTTRARSNDGE